MIQKPDNSQFKIFVVKAGIGSFLVVAICWSLPLASIHSNTPLIGGAWFATLVGIIKFTGLVASIGVVAFGLMLLAEKSGLSWSKIRKAHHQAVNARLKNEKLKLEIELLPQVIHSGMDRGFNVEYGGAKVSTPIERVHESFRYDQPKQDIGEPPPEQFSLFDTLSDYEPSEKGILLGKSNRGLVTIPLGDQMCHMVSASKTGGGKTNLQRITAAQLLHLNQEVYFCDPTWQDIRVNQSTGQMFDYRPIKANLAGLETTPTGIANTMRMLADESQRRMRAGHSRALRFPRKYVILDELPFVAQYAKEVMNYVGIVIRIGRNYGIYIIVAAQDMQNSTLGVDSGSFRNNFLTNFFGDGDLATARIILHLDKGEKPDLYKVGKNGVFLLNAPGYSDSRTKVRVPLGDNEAIYQLLGNRPEIPVEQEAVEEYADEPTVSYESISEHSDVERVRAAVAELQGRNEKPSSRKVAEITGFSKSKCATILKTECPNVQMDTWTD